MKLFGRRNEESIKVLTNNEKRLKSAINSVESEKNIETITNDIEAQMVLESLLRDYGIATESRDLRNQNLSLEQNREQIIEVVLDISALLDSPLASGSIRAALSHFVFTSGITFESQPEIVLSSFETMLQTDAAQTYLTLFDEDSIFTEYVKSYVLVLPHSESKTLIEGLMKIADKHAPQLCEVFERLETASITKQYKETKTANKTSKETRGEAKNPAVGNSPKFCGNCGSPLSAGAKFCGSCGSPTNFS